MTYRVLVTGSRDWTHPAPIRVVLDAILAAHPDMVLVHGDCRRGADRIADRWAMLHDVPREPHPADWTRGRGAGYARNADMVASAPAECAAFILGGSRGATHCADLAERAGIPTSRTTA